MSSKICVHFCTIDDPASIFGSVGRCGGGYNTVWSDWSEEGILKRQQIIEEFEYRMNEICGHYERLEQSILESGFQTPLLITCGDPIRRQRENLPPWLLKKPKTEWLILEGTSGGSRLWVAQKHNISVPCIINDRTGRFSECEQITTIEQAKTYFTDPPQITLGTNGLWTTQPSKTHLDNKWNDEKLLDGARRPMWKEIMHKHGYSV